MSDKIIKNPHDRFFKSMMTNPTVIRDFFEKHLPENIKSMINYDSITPQDNTFIDEYLRLQESDVLYATEFNGQAGYLYLLVEHQSTPCELMPFRLLKYMVSIMDKHLLITQENRLPIIYPVIVYNGWKNYMYSTDIFDLFGKDKELAKNFLLKPYKLIDLSKVSDENLKINIKYDMMLYVMKHIYKKGNDFLLTLQAITKALKLFEESGDIEYIDIVFSYMLECGDIDRQDFIDIVNTGLSPASGERIMTVAEQYKQEGIQLGKQGALENVAFGLLKEKKLTDAEVIKYTGLTMSDVEKLKKKITAVN